MNFLQIPLHGPLFCPVLKWDGACNGPHFPMIRWRPFQNGMGRVTGPVPVPDFAENLGLCITIILRWRLISIFLFLNSNVWFKNPKSEIESIIPIFN